MHFKTYNPLVSYIPPCPEKIKKKKEKEKKKASVKWNDLYDKVG